MVGIGIDLEEVLRFRRRPFSKNTRFYRRLFSDIEIHYCLSFADPAPHFAARFCAKEALVKASHNVFAMRLFDVQVQNQKNGAPLLCPWAKRKEVLRFFKTHEAYLSLSHTDSFGLAFVVVTKKRK